MNGEMLDAKLHIDKELGHIAHIHSLLRTS